MSSVRSFVFKDLVFVSMDCIFVYTYHGFVSLYCVFNSPGTIFGLAGRSFVSFYCADNVILLEP